MKSYSLKRRLFCLFLYVSGISWLFLKLTKNRKNIHVYGHRVLNKNSKINNFFINSGHAISKNDFTRKIKLLKNNFLITSLEQSVKKKNNSNHFTISFDDGYKDNISIAFPILKQSNIPMHIFVTSEIIEHKLLFWPDILGYICSEIEGEYKFIFSDDCFLFNDKYRVKSYLAICAKLKEYDNEKIYDIINSIIKQTDFNSNIDLEEIYLSKDEIKSSHNLISFGGHSLKHENLIYLNSKDLKNSISKSIDYVTNLKYEGLKTFAYPYGSYNSRTINCLIENNLCDYAFTTKPDSNSSNYEVGRINVNISPYYVFHVEISGVFGWIKGIFS